jgi:hypothetical protein
MYLRRLSKFPLLPNLRNQLLSIFQLFRPASSLLSLPPSCPRKLHQMGHKSWPLSRTLQNLLTMICPRPCPRPRLRSLLCLIPHQFLHLHCLQVLLFPPLTQPTLRQNPCLSHANEWRASWPLSSPKSQLPQKFPNHPQRFPLRHSTPLCPRLLRLSLPPWCPHFHLQWVKKLSQCLAILKRLAWHKSSKLHNNLKIIYVILGHLSF